MRCDGWCLTLDDTQGMSDGADGWSSWVTELIKSIEGSEVIGTEICESNATLFY